MPIVPANTDMFTSTKRPGPAQRLLDAASDLFARHGIRSVGIDAILREAGVAKASLYSSYGSKNALIVAYLADLDHRDRVRWNEAAAQLTDPIAKILVFFDLAPPAKLPDQFQGCAYANAAAEFPETEMKPITVHRNWMRDTIASLLTDAGVAEVHKLARNLQFIYEGALLGSKLDRSTEPIQLGKQFARDLIAQARESP